MAVPAPRLADEQARIALLLGCGLLDSPPEPAFDDVVKLACAICETPMAVVSLIDVTRSWFKAKVGLAGDEAPRDDAFCAHAIAETKPLVIEDALRDPRFAENPFVLHDPHVRFYAGVPLRLEPTTSAIGTLCVVDTRPRTLSPEQLDALVALARRLEKEIAERPELRGSADRGRAHELDAASLVAGRYRIGTVLGEGAMGRVFAADDTVAKRRVALKFLSRTPNGISAMRERVERFAREAKALLKVRHPNVAEIYDVGNVDGGEPFIVMEYLAGQDLSKHLSAPMDIARAVEIVRDACEGVAAAHACGIVHRDIKPANILLATMPDGTTRVKLLDFGVSKLMDDGAPSAALTTAASICGSPLYMSPEQMLSSHGVDHLTDVWSLGATLYEMLAGKPPFPGEIITAVCAAIFSGPPPPLRECRSDVSPELEAVVLRCLSRNKAARWQSAKELGDALRECMPPRA